MVKKNQSIEGKHPIFFSLSTSLLAPPIYAKLPTHFAYEALQNIVNLQLPPGINFGILLKRSEITQIGYLWSDITHHIWNEFISLQSIIYQNRWALQQFIKADPKEICDIFFDPNYQIDNINNIKPKIRQSNHITVKRGTF